MDTTTSASTCGLCGQPMPPGEEMFLYHGYSGPCPPTPNRCPVSDPHLPHDHCDGTLAGDRPIIVESGEG